MQLAEVTPRDDLEHETDEALVDLARRGRETAVRALIKRYNRRLFRVARAVLHDDTEAEDVVQEAYVKGFTRLDSFRGQSRFSTWLTRIALNEALDRKRRVRPAAEVEELDAAAFANGSSIAKFPLSLVPLAADTEVMRMEVAKLLEDAISALPEPFRVVFVLRDVEAMSIEETAALLDLKPETVKSRLHRARKALRAFIEERFVGSFADVFPFDGIRCTGIADRVVACLKQA